jgi:hypothetical protein
MAVMCAIIGTCGYSNIKHQGIRAGVDHCTSPSLLQMYTIIAPFSLRPMKIMEQANRLMQRAQALYEDNKDIMKPKDREVAKDKMSE